MRLKLPSENEYAVVIDYNGIRYITFSGDENRALKYYEEAAPRYLGKGAKPTVKLFKLIKSRRPY